MDQFVVSARKYRPATFEAVVGQGSVTNTLKNAIRNNHLAQAFLFCGPRGVGKTTCARILAKAVNAESLDHLDQVEDDPLNIFELDAASNNSVEDIRNLIDQVRIAPQAGKQYKVYIIDEVHMLSQAAFNAFLKTLEEPPPYAIFILATTEKHKILPTILSRCQIFDFNRIKISEMAEHLQQIASQESIEAEPDALHLIAQKADGALRDALSIFDQMVSFSGKTITYQNVIDNLNILDYDYYFKVAESILQQQIPSALLIFDDILNNGFDGHNFLNGLAEHFRNLLVCQDPVTLKLLEVGERVRARYSEQAQQWSNVMLLQGLDLLSKSDVQYKSSKNQRLLVEITLMQLCSMSLEKKKSERGIIIKSAPLGETPDAKAVTPESAPVNGAPAAEKAAPVAAAVPEPPERPSPPPPKAPPPPTRPASYRGSGISIQAALNQGNNLKEPDASYETADSEAASAAAGLQESFSEELLLKVWNEYSVKLEDRGLIQMATVLKTRKPNLKDNFQIELLLSQKIEESTLNENRSDLLEYLRLELQNASIQLSYRVESIEVENRPYSNKDKFDHLAEKNPHLLTLKQKLDLDPS